MLDDSIRVVEDKFASTARVDLKRRVITIPALDYSKPMTAETYRITKSFVDHESAHILFTPAKYKAGLSHFPEHLKQIVNLLEDARIERLYSQRYVGIKEDLLELNRKIFSERMLDSVESNCLQAMLSLMFAYCFHVQATEGRHFHPDTEAAFQSRVRQILDPFISSSGLHPEKPAQRIFDILQELYAKGETEKPEPKPSSEKSKGEDSKDGPAPKPECDPQASTEKPEQPSASTTLPETHAHDESRVADATPTFQEALQTALSRTDVKEYLEDQLASVSQTPPRDDSLIHPYRDRIIRIQPEQFPTHRRSHLYEDTITTHAALISSYRALFSTTLVSLQKSRRLSTFSGCFDSRHASRVLTSLSPRVFTKKLPGTVHAYDVSVLLDTSASMKSDDCGSESKILIATRAMIILAEALKSLSRISFEVLSFTADTCLDVPTRRVLGCANDNVVYELKSFSEKGSGIIPDFYDIAMQYQLLSENFDLAAIKVASRRLLANPTGNRKLLIVLSDGIPCCRNNSSERILADYINRTSCKHPVFGIGIQNPYITKLYPHAVNVTELSTLGTEVLSTIRQFILRDADRKGSTSV
jgi:hypothetical protein